jgi:hypothetical protein
MSGFPHWGSNVLMDLHRSKRDASPQPQCHGGMESYGQHRRFILPGD